MSGVSSIGRFLAGVLAVAFVVLAWTAGCTHGRYFPEKASRPYPAELHTTETVDIQVFRDDQWIEIVNSTARSYRDFDLWVNQRYVRHVDELRAGQTLRLSLWEFHDERGDVMNAGGIWRTIEPTPLRMVEIQPAPDAKTIGLVTIREDEP